MDPELIQGVLTAILGTGGVGGILAGYWAHKSRSSGQPGKELAARREAAPDWAGFNDYWKAENAGLRRANAALQRKADRQAAADAAHIDRLEKHIWLGNPPPPPTRDKDD